MKVQRSVTGHKQLLYTSASPSEPAVLHNRAPLSNKALQSRDSTQLIAASQDFDSLTLRTHCHTLSRVTPCTPVFDHNSEIKCVVRARLA